ncbi:hypothetical protein MMC34_008028 [Xylographa carneopallida]|nr:hypothetical protein [Xylographa carneopallida]
MCGIFFSCSIDGPIFPSENLLDSLKRRGPDNFNVVQRTCQSVNRIGFVTQDSPVQLLHLVFVSTVLSLRGNAIVEQPLVDDNSGSVLCWNGEAWSLDKDPITGNDAQAVFDALLKSTQTFSVGREKQPDEKACRGQAVLRTIGRLSGPFSFVFYDALSQQVFYGRDAIGRRSLLHSRSSPHDYIVSSISDSSASGAWTEVGAYGIQIINLPGDLPSTEHIASKVSVAIEAFPFINTIPWSAIKHTKTESLFSSSIKVLHSNQDIWDVVAGPQTSTINREMPPPAFGGLCFRSEAVDSLYKHLHASLLLRMQGIALSSANTPQNHIAILFSGGLDCTLMARIVHDILPLDISIDLLNVAFENPRVIAAANALTAQNKQHVRPITAPYGQCPDRVTGLSSCAELREICSDRIWRLVSIDIPYFETLAHRGQIVSLIRPHDTEMDFSIACALYFASRGVGHLYDPVTKCSTMYTTPARILLSGLGADELFGGYSRHAKAFAREGHHGILDELELDFHRLGKRNLGRDDRVISHWGKEARYPYLDEAVVTWALGRPLHEKCNFGRESYIKGVPKGDQPTLEPDKHVLRLLAWRLAMPGAAREKKRAIQFGSRTAKMVPGRKSGTGTIETVAS